MLMNQEGHYLLSGGRELAPVQHCAYSCNLTDRLQLHPPILVCTWHVPYYNDSQ